MMRRLEVTVATLKVGDEVDHGRTTKKIEQVCSVIGGEVLTDRSDAEVKGMKFEGDMNIWLFPHKALIVLVLP